MKERFPTSDPQVIKESPRSEAAKKRWERERQKNSLERGVMNQVPPMKAWVYHTEWAALMVTLIGCFIFCFRETIHTNDRLDAHMDAISRRADQLTMDINRRADQISIDANRRADELHREFYDLLKETRRPSDSHQASYVYTVEQKT